MTDGDGDTATSSIAFQVVDANAPTPGTATAAVDDDGLAGGNAASTVGDLDANIGDLDGAASSEVTFSGVLGGSVGNDVPGTLQLRGAGRHQRNRGPRDGELRLGRRHRHTDGDGPAAARCSRSTSPIRRPAPTR